MKYFIGLVVALTAGWFVLSGQTKPLFYVLAGMSVLAALWATARLEIIDRDSSPYHRGILLFSFMGWLFIEMIKANIAVIRAIFRPVGALSPGVTVTRCQARSDLGRTLLANSITLTPGTVTLDIADGKLMIHALQGDGLTSDSFTEFSRRSVVAGDERG
ncbi:cation:proton antiporter [bacterium]|nr:cation:proton antiporter [bacterium]